MIRFFAHVLLILAAWTLVIKFVLPLVYDWHYGHAPGTHIMWDFWWVAHLWLAYCLLSWKSYTLLLAVVVSVVEIAIIVVKFVLFLSAPDWNQWTMNWFVNKIFVLSCFIALLVYIVINRKDFLIIAKGKA